MRESLATAKEKLQPLLAKASEPGAIDSTKCGMSYLEMKYNLMISYCQFLAFYILLKLEGGDVRAHPVLLKLTHVRTLIEKLKPLDKKLQYQIDKQVSNASGVEQALKYKPRLSELHGESDEQSSDQDRVAAKKKTKSQAARSSDKDDSVEGASDQAETQPQKYKAPKSNAVAFTGDENKRDRKQRQKDEYDARRTAKSAYLEEMRQELAEEPEEVFMGGAARKTKTAKYEEVLEASEMQNFKRV